MLLRMTQPQLRRFSRISRALENCDHGDVNEAELLRVKREHPDVYRRWGDMTRSGDYDEEELCDEAQEYIGFHDPWENTSNENNNLGWNHHPRAQTPIVPSLVGTHPRAQRPRPIVRTHPRANALAPHLNTQNLATYSHIPYHRARYIPENMVNGKIMHVYNKGTLDEIHHTQGVSPYTRRVFSGGQKVPRRLRTAYMKQHRQQIQQNVIDEVNRQRETRRPVTRSMTRRQQ